MSQHRRCFGVLPENRHHFCRWNIAQEGHRNPDPPIQRAPIYRWVLKK